MLHPAGRPSLRPTRSLPNPRTVFAVLALITAGTCMEAGEFFIFKGRYTFSPFYSTIGQALVFDGAALGMGLLVVGHIVAERYKIPPGHCQICGYNLTGNVSGRCPECGKACKRVY
jgi:hypothetical protein